MREISEEIKTAMDTTMDNKAEREEDIDLMGLAMERLYHTPNNRMNGKASWEAHHIW